MKIIKKIGFLILILHLCSCDKEGELTTVTGNVTDFYSTESVLGYYIALTQQKKNYHSLR